MDGWMGKCLNRWKMDVWMDGWMNRQRNVWMDGCFFAKYFAKDIVCLFWF